MLKRIKGFSLFFVIYLVLFALFFTSLFTIGTKVKAESNITMVDGAQVRTTGNQGIRFIANFNDISGYSEIGFVCTKGTYSFEEMASAFSTVDEWTSMSQTTPGFNYEKGSSNSISFIKTYSTNIEPGSKEIKLTVFGIDENNYITDLTVFAYGKLNDEVVLSDISVSRNLAEVAMQSNAGGTSQGLINTVTSYAKDNYKKLRVNSEGELVISGFDSFAVEDISSMKELLISDLNEILGLNISSDASYKEFVSAIAPSTSIKLDVTEVNIWKFFNDEKMKAKWDWLAKYLLDNGSTHVKNQAREILEDGKITSDGVVVDGITLTNLYGCEHFASAVYLVLTQGKESYTASNYWLDMDFSSLSVYDAVAEYANLIYFDNSEVVQIGKTTKLPMENNETSLFNGWSDGINVYVNNYVVTSDNVSLTKKYTNNVVVDGSWNEKQQYEIVNYNGQDYIYGVTAFSDLNSSLDVVLKDMTINVASGLYQEEVLINKDGVTLAGPNVDITANGNAERVEEAVITGVITLGQKVNNITINGFKFVDDAQVKLSQNETVSSAKMDVVGFTFSNNYVDKGTSTTRAINFAETNRYYNDEVVIDNCYFTANSIASSDDVIYVENTDGLTVINSTFENISGSAVSIYDTTNGLGLRGDLYIENNTFKNIYGNALWVQYIGFDVNKSHEISIKGNLFEDVQSTCLRFINTSANYVAKSFVVDDNTFTNTPRGALLSDAVFGVDTIITNSTFENITDATSGDAIKFANTSAKPFSGNLTVENCSFKTITRAAIWVQYTTFDTNNTYNISIKRNLFEDIDGAACVDLEEADTNNVPASFNVSENEFKDIAKIFWSAVSSSNFKYNKIYMYNGTVSNPYVAKGAGASAIITCGNNLFMSADGLTIYTKPSTNFSSFINTRVNGFDENNYSSLDDYEAAIDPQKQEYTITYNDNDIIVLEDSYTMKDEVVLPVLADKPGLIFNGWYDNPELIGEAITVIPSGSTGNKVYYASWTEGENLVIVNPEWTGLTGNFTYDEKLYTIGLNAFVTISEALDIAVDGSTIKVLVGTYAEDFTISKSNITLVGPNAEITANGTAERVEEAVLSGVITLSGSVTNITVKGFKLVDNVQVTNGTENASGYYVTDFTFANNYVDKGVSTTKAINFQSGDYYTKNIIIDNCYFTANSIAATENVISIYNNDNLTVTNSTFENISGRAVSVYDSANSSGLRQNLTVENNTFRTIVGSALWINYTNFSTTSTYSISIKKNLFEDVDGGACIDFEKCGGRNIAAKFDVVENTFKDVYKCLYTAAKTANFTDNLVYLYGGALTGGYIARGGASGSYAGAVTCGGNLYLSADGNTISTTLATSLFNTRVTGYNDNNYASIEDYEAAIAALK